MRRGVLDDRLVSKAFDHRGRDASVDGRRQSKQSPRGSPRDKARAEYASAQAALASVLANDVSVRDLIVTADLVDCVTRPVELEHSQEVVDDVLDRYRLGKRLNPARGG